MTYNPESARGFLTEQDREYLRGESELSEGSEYNTRRRIRYRALQAMRDFSLLFSAPQRDLDRQRVFEQCRENEDQLEALIETVAYLYWGIEECGLDFERLLAAGALPGDENLADLRPFDGAIIKAERARNREVTAFEMHIETEPRDVDGFRERVREGDPELDRSDVLGALQRRVITQDEFWGWQDAQESRSKRLGHTGPTDILDDEHE